MSFANTTNEKTKNQMSIPNTNNEKRHEYTQHKHRDSQWPRKTTPTAAHTLRCVSCAAATHLDGLHAVLDGALHGAIGASVRTIEALLDLIMIHSSITQRHNHVCFVTYLVEISLCLAGLLFSTPLQVFCFLVDVFDTGNSRLFD